MKQASSAAMPGLRTSLMVGIVALLALCSVQFIYPQSVSADSTSYVRIVHAAPDVGTVDVFMDGTRILSNFQFGTVTGYIPLPAGTHSIQAALIGKGINAAVISKSIAVTAGTPYTVAALGTNTDGFTLRVFADDNLVVNNQAKVRVYHLSPGVGDVRVAASANTLIDQLSYPQASDYVSVPAGAYTFDLTLPNNATVPLSAQLKSWTVTSIFAVGMLNGSPKFQLLSNQVPGLPGLPNTGSDPHASVPASQPLIPWAPASLALLLLSAGLILRRSKKSHVKN